MKIFKRILIAAVGVGSLAAPIGLGAVAHAQEFTPCFRDLSLNKQVKVPGGVFVDAHTSSSAPSATVGDTVEWKISVTNVTSGGCEEFDLPGTIVVHDILPAGFTFVSSSGLPTYDSSTNDWKFPAATVGSMGTVELTIDTTATQGGTFENVATLSNLIICQQQIEADITCTTYNYAIDNADDPLYGVKDKNTQNDSSNAWVSISGKPVVLGESTTLPNTGSGVGASLAAGGLIAATAVISLAGRRKLAYKFNR